MQINYPPGWTKGDVDLSLDQQMGLHPDLSLPLAGGEFGGLPVYTSGIYKGRTAGQARQLAVQAYVDAGMPPLAEYNPGAGTSPPGTTPPGTTPPGTSPPGTSPPGTSPPDEIELRPGDPPVAFPEPEPVMPDGDATITEQIVREAPEIEAYKLGLLKSGLAAAKSPLDLPSQTVAALSPLELQAIRDIDATGGIGAYQAIAQGGRGTLGTGVGAFGQALGALGAAPGYLRRGSDELGRSARTLQGSLGRAGGPIDYTAGQYGTAALGPQTYTAQAFDPSTAASYFNPYEDIAVQQALTDIRRQGDIAQSQLAAQAVGSGAFGGSREGIQREEIGRNVLEQQGRTAASMRQAGYLNAMQQAQQDFADQQRRAQAQAQFGTQFGQQAFEDAQRRAQAQAQFGSSFGQQIFEDQQRRRQAAAASQQGIASLYGNLAGVQQAQAGQYGNVGQALGNLGTQQLAAAAQAQQQGLAGIQARQSLGSMQRQHAQALADATFQNQQRRLYEPMTRLSWLSDIYKGAPSTQSAIGSVVSPSPPSPSAFQQVAGFGTGLLGAAVGAKQLKLF